MKHLASLFLSLLVVWLAGSCVSPKSSAILEPPAGNRYCTIDTTGETIIPNGRIVAPMGTTVRIAPHPYGLALSPDGRTAVTANSGNRPFSITLIDRLDSPRPRTRQIPEGPVNQPNLLADVFMGLAFSPDGKSIYVAGAQANCIFQFEVTTGIRLDSISCGGVDFEGREINDGYIGDMVMDRAGKYLYAVDQINFRLITVDLSTRKMIHQVPTGRYPFGVSLSPDGSRVFVANVGVFAYQPVRPIGPDSAKFTGAPFALSGYNTAESQKGYRTEAYEVPGLGDPNSPEALSVWAFDVKNGRPVLSNKVKTGFLVGEKIEGIPAVGGASPNSVVANSRYVFVSNGNNDCISAIDLQNNQIAKQIFLKAHPALSRYRGVIPFGLALSPDGRRLYAAESGINAVAVIDAEKLEVLGHLPVGWFPSKLAVTPDGRRLIVANAKGYGSGPNGGANFKVGPAGTYVGHLMNGSVTVLDIPGDSLLGKWTAQVLKNNFQERKPAVSDNPIPQGGKKGKSPIQYIVFISKENRTYDEIFGQLKAGKGDPTIARYGYKQTFSNRSGRDTVREATVMPNHLDLARHYCISDNFYVDSDHSADGHRWLVNTYPNEWVEASVAAGYGGKRRLKRTSTAPGKFAFVGAAGSIYPEDYNEAGSMWDHLSRNGISFFNYGFGTEIANSFSDSTMKYGGVRPVINYPVPAPLFVNTAKEFPTYNMAIPDQYRADVFIKDYKKRWLETGKTPPQVITLMLPNDHGAGERPHAGYPYRESYMADNDLALGRVIEFLSSTPYWKNMAVFITEDDAQDGVDHVDAHRSLLMVCSPYAKRNYIGHTHYSFGSIFKTFWNILGVPYLNQYDAGAADLRDLFTAEADYSPFFALPSELRIFNPEKALKPFDEKFDWKSLLESPQLDNVEDFINEKNRKQ